MTDLALDLDSDSRLRAVGPVPLIALGLIVVALIAALAIWGRAWFPALPSEDMTIALVNVPEVEPVVLEAVSEETARELNAATPFSTLAVPAARPFKFLGGGTDYARAVDCLASAIYYEAGAEPREGMEAVAQVILNRVRHPAFPKSICGVIFQGQERRTGCQFSYTCDGSMARRPSSSAWENMRSVARSMIGGKVNAAVGWATHYHTDWVRPVWSSKLDKVAAVRTHLFFRWPGVWGSAKAFGRGGATEAAMARLVGLSAVHRTPETLAQAEEIAKLMAALAAGGGAASGDTVFSDPAGGQFILTIAPGSDPGLLPGLADRTCAGRDYCKVFAWADAGNAPKGFPIDDKAFGTMAFSFYRNKAEDFEKPLWNCAVFPRDDKRQCIRKRVVIEGKPQELIPMAAEAPAEPPRAVAASGGLRPMDPDTGEPVAAPPPVSRTEGRRRPGAGTD
jgi:hypothetical protein